jgi:hypothetical protein
MRWVETGKGKLGSIFVNEFGEQLKAIREGRTVGGYQIYRLIKSTILGRVEKIVYVKNRRELKKLLNEGKILI